jgi:sulfoxide reductase heme-binding subunit YedZ
MTSHDPLDYGWWLASRSAGIVAYLLLSAAVLAGLAMALRLGPPKLRRSLRAMHEQLALLALGATAAHGLLLLADPWLKPGLAGLLVPFASSYRPVWTGLGVLAAYLAAALSLTYYVRGRLGARRWRRAHRLIPIAWALAAVHVVGAGTDAVSLWLQVPVALTAALVLALLGERVLGTRRPRARAAEVPPAPAPAAAAEAPALPATASPPAPLWSKAAAGADRGEGARTAAG